MYRETRTTSPICKWHEFRRAVTGCILCGANVCNDCRGNGDDSHICIECSDVFTGLRDVVERSRPRTFNDSLRKAFGESSSGGFYSSVVVLLLTFTLFAYCARFLFPSFEIELVDNLALSREGIEFDEVWRLLTYPLILDHWTELIFRTVFWLGALYLVERGIGRVSFVLLLASFSISFGMLFIQFSDETLRGFSDMEFGFFGFIFAFYYRNRDHPSSKFIMYLAIFIGMLLGIGLLVSFSTYSLIVIGFSIIGYYIGRFWINAPLNSYFFYKNAPAFVLIIASGITFFTDKYLLDLL